MADYLHNDISTDEFTADEAKSCAILAIDMLGEVKGGPLEDKLLAPTLNAARILEAARAHGIPVIFTNDAHYEGIDFELELWGNHNLYGSPDAQPSPELNQQPSDFVIEKPKYSAFFQTRLRSLLQDLGVKTLVCCGFDTNICVKHTAADGYFNGFKIVLVEDATETFLIGTQEDGLDYMRKCYAASIVSTEDVLSAIDAL